MRIIFVRAPSFSGETFSAEGRCQQPFRASYDILLPPLSSMYAASIIEKEGYDASIIDCQARWMSPHDFIKRILDSSPDFLMFQSGVHTLNSDIEIANQIKESNQAIKTAFFDVFPTILHIEIAKEKGIDFVVRGEPERILCEIVNRYDKRGDLNNIPGTTLFHGGKVVVNREREPLDLDYLPFPARHLINIDDYIQPFTHEAYQPVQTSRGCPYQCIFCIAPKYYGRKLRFRSVESIIDEMEECIEKYKIHWFYFFSDTFTLKKEQIIDLCKEILDKNLNIHFWGNSRVDTIDEEMAKYLKKAGCESLSFGIESGNPETLEKLKKGITLEDTNKAIKLCKEYGIESNAFVIVGFPWEDKEMILNTINFVKKLDPDFAQFLTPIPFPSTELYEICKKENLIVNPNVFDNYQTCVVKTLDLSSEEIRRIVKKAHLRFYIRPKKIFSLLRKEKLLTLLRAGVPILINRLRNR
jgi:anaerobic magnesium-protoporphyrin IX monomethyl ester cyclase